MVPTSSALGAAVLALLVANAVASSAAVKAPEALDKRIYQAKHMTFQEAVVEASRRGGQRRDKSEACMNCCDKGCKTITGAKKCEDLIGADTGEAAGKHADEACDADGLDCSEDENGCLCVWLYKNPDNCPKDANDQPDCKSMSDYETNGDCRDFGKAFTEAVTGAFALAGGVLIGIIVAIILISICSCIACYFCCCRKQQQTVVVQQGAAVPTAVPAN